MIAVYCEDFRDGRAFARAGAAATAAGKPVIVLAAGGSEAGARAAASHTGALVSDVGRGRRRLPCRRHPPSHHTEGADRPRARVPLATSRPRGRRVAIVGDGGGTGVVAADLATALGLELPRLSDALGERLRRSPATSSTANPVDLAGAGEQDFCELRARHDGCARVRRGRRRRPHRLLRWLQRDERGVPRARDRGRAARSSPRWPRPGAAPRAGDVLALGAGARAARGRRARLPRHRGRPRDSRQARRHAGSAGATCPASEGRRRRRSGRPGTSRRASSARRPASPFADARFAGSPAEARRRRRARRLSRSP